MNGHYDNQYGDIKKCSIANNHDSEILLLVTYPKDQKIFWLYILGLITMSNGEKQFQIVN